MRTFFHTLGTRLPLPLILIVIAVLNVYWTLTLNAFGAQFEQVSGLQPLDLQNVSGVLTPQAAFDQIVTYTAEAKALYWSFFILDNLMPPLAFGSYMLFWAYVLARSANPLFRRILASPLMFIPLGVGLFDGFENLAFVTAIANAPDPQALNLLQIGLTFVQLKALCLFATFGITLVLLIVLIITSVRRVIDPSRTSLQPNPATTR